MSQDYSCDSYYDSLTRCEIFTLNILCYGEMADNYFSEIVVSLLNKLRSGIACEVIIEAETRQETIGVAVGLRKELEENLNLVSPAVIEEIRFIEKTSYRSINPNRIASFKKTMLLVYSADAPESEYFIPNPNIISKIKAGVRNLFSKKVDSLPS